MPIPNRTALIIALRNKLEHNPATVYKAVYLGEMAAAVEAAGWTAHCLDLDVGDASLTSLIAAFRKAPQAVLLWTEVHQARLARQVAQLAKKVDERINVFVYGRATVFIPQYFERAPFDAVHVSGDREAAVMSYLQFVAGEIPAARGVAVRDADSGTFVRTPGDRLASSEWPLPNLGALPLHEYRDFAARTHGAHYSHRLAITVSKGCELSCAYCGAHREEGNVDRRRSVGHVLHWARNHKRELDGSLLHLFASNLFEDANWIREFCHGYREDEGSFLWRGVTTVRSLTDPDLVALAGANGCRELAVGVETLSTRSLRTAKSSYAEFEAAVRNTARAGIDLKGLVMLGYPGQTEADIGALEALAQQWGITLRYTGYTPLHRLRGKSAAELDALDIEAYDRRTYFDARASQLSPDFFYDRISENGGYFYPAIQSGTSDRLSIVST